MLLAGVAQQRQQHRPQFFHHDLALLTAKRAVERHRQKLLQVLHQPGQGRSSSGGAHGRQLCWIDNLLTVPHGDQLR